MTSGSGHSAQGKPPRLAQRSLNPVRDDRLNLAIFACLQSPALPPGTTQRTLSIIMGGGAGTRLFPLTKDRSKPAVPLGGKYRLVDIPITNCINSGLRSIYVLTQFNSMSLHRHIQSSYKFDNFSRSFVEILAAQQTPEGSNWYQGTADAVRQNLRYFLEQPVRVCPHPERRPALPDGFPRRARTSTSARGRTSRSRRSRCSAPRPPISASCRADADRRITRFEEKPKDAALARRAEARPPSCSNRSGSHADEELFQASMGIYVFNRAGADRLPRQRPRRFRQARHPEGDRRAPRQRLHLQGLLGRHRNDPRVLRRESRPHRRGAAVQFLRHDAPIYTHPRFLPGSKINGATMRQAIISDGCIISDAHIERSVIGVRSIIRSGTTIRNSVDHGRRPFRDADAPAAAGDAADRDRAQLRHRPRDHRQERAHRRRRRDHAGRQTGRTSTGKITTSATGSWWCRKTR